MDYFAVIDTETNWNNEVMSIGAVIAEKDTFKKVDDLYFIVDPEYKIGGMFSMVLPVKGRAPKDILLTRKIVMEKFKEAFEKYFELARNKEELKKYLINLVFQQTQEKYINYLIEIDKTYETQEKLESLFDKTYYFKYLEKNNQLIPIKHRNQYITYLYNAKKYDKLLEYKEFLNLDMLKFLGNNGYKVEVVEIIRKNYPLEIEYADLEKIEYFYFNEKHIFDEDLVKELLREKQLSPVETYYLSRYYGNLGEKEKALELEYALKGNYNLKFIED